MARANTRQPKAGVTIRVPAPSEDRVPFARVGIFAAVGFVVGIAWPGLAQLRLVPPPPDSGSSNSSGATKSQPAGSSASASDPGDPKAERGPSGSELPKSPSVEIKIGKVQVTSCADAKGKKHEDCDLPDFGKVLSPSFEAMAACPESEGKAGLLSLGLDLDFGQGTASNASSGSSTTLSRASTKALLDCASRSLAGVSLSTVEHRYEKYRAYFAIELASRSDQEDPRAEPADQIVAASGKATVVWEVALIRKAPKDGELMARVLGGTRVQVTGRQGDWYRVKYDAEGNEGWVFRSAIGL